MGGYRRTTYEEQGEDCSPTQGEEVSKDPVLIDVSAQMSHLIQDQDQDQDQNHEQTSFRFKPGVCGDYYNGLTLQHTGVYQ